MKKILVTVMVMLFILTACGKSEHYQSQQLVDIAKQNFEYKAIEVKGSIVKITLQRDESEEEITNELIKYINTLVKQKQQASRLIVDITTPNTNNVQITYNTVQYATAINDSQTLKQQATNYSADMAIQSVLSEEDFKAQSTVILNQLMQVIKSIGEVQSDLRLGISGDNDNRQALTTNLQQADDMIKEFNKLSINNIAESQQQYFKDMQTIFSNYSGVKDLINNSIKNNRTDLDEVLDFKKFEDSIFALKEAINN